ncbi:MAG: DinB family protein [Chloroflexi bacterium]|nr:DinB family protein [Chloroflexota bacterium]
MSTQQNTTVSLLRKQIQGAHQLLQGTMQSVNADMAHWTPDGIANPIDANYAHVVLSEDGLINGLLKGGAPLFATQWAGKTGVNQMPPSPDPAHPGFPNWSGWAHAVQIDLQALHTYAQAVFAATDEYLATLQDENLQRKADLSALGLQEASLVDALNGGVLSNTYTHTGEIACLKGLQGAQGYPF